PCVKALGNQATTTAFLPLKSARWYVFPSLPARVKSGAAAPPLSSAPRAAGARDSRDTTARLNPRMPLPPALSPLGSTRQYMPPSRAPIRHEPCLDGLHLPEPPHVPLLSREAGPPEGAHELSGEGGAGDPLSEPAAGHV